MKLACQASIIRIRSCFFYFFFFSLFFFVVVVASAALLKPVRFAIGTAREL